MQKSVDAVRKGILYISALVLVAGYPTAAMATTQEPTTIQEPMVAEQQVVPTTEEKAKEPTYTYDPETKKWNSEEWQFNQNTNAYEKPPEPIIIEPEASSGVQNSTSQPNVASDTTSETSATTNVDVNNSVNSDATSGDALIAENTTAGSALSGDATAVANIINAVNSSVTTGENQKVATFTKDIYGDVKGDIILYPMLLKAMLEQKAQANGGTAINTTTDFTVNNDVNVSAQTGDATVKNNTTAGDATTGNATAMANVINILNSMIATQDSFIGTINIFGSLEGDILIAPDFISQMLENNGGSNGSNTKLSSKDTTEIVNNISAVAESGAASVLGNTTGGNAKTGDATSNVVIFNVTGRDIVAENSMLVFVNVLGRWVGMIVDAPEGATAAMIGSGVKSDEKYSPDLTLVSESRHGITNTINVTAGTGDATVANNTKAGNATSGNAHAFANVANVSSSSLSLTGWFGLLFINITGDWLGSFDINTPYGDPPKETPPIEVKPTPTRPIEFVPAGGEPVRTVNTSTTRIIFDSRQTTSVGSSMTETETTVETPEVTESEPEAEVQGLMDTADPEETVETESSNKVVLMIVGVVALIGASVIGVRRFF